MNKSPRLTSSPLCFPWKAVTLLWGPKLACAPLIAEEIIAPNRFSKDDLTRLGRKNTQPFVSV